MIETNLPDISPAADNLSKRYRLLGHIGEGAMGVVYRAFDRLTGETVALKRLLADSDGTWIRQDLARACEHPGSGNCRVIERYPAGPLHCRGRVDDANRGSDGGHGSRNVRWASRHEDRNDWLWRRLARP